MRTQNSSLLDPNSSVDSTLAAAGPANRRAGFTSSDDARRRLCAHLRGIALASGLVAVLPDAAISAPNPQLEWKVLEEAHEIINIEPVLAGHPEEPLATYKSAGSNPIPDDLWPAYTPPLPYTKNTTRNLQFNESQFIASPGAPIGTTTYVTTPDGYTWGAMSLAINALWPYHPAQYSGLPAVNTYYAGNLVVTPPPGVVKVTA